MKILLLHQSRGRLSHFRISHRIDLKSTTKVSKRPGRRQEKPVESFMFQRFTTLVWQRDQGVFISTTTSLSGQGSVIPSGENARCWPFIQKPCSCASLTRSMFIFKRMFLTRNSVSIRFTPCNKRGRKRKCCQEGRMPSMWCTKSVMISAQFQGMIPICGQGGTGRGP